MIRPLWLWATVIVLLLQTPQRASGAPPKLAGQSLCVFRDKIRAHYFENKLTKKPKDSTRLSARPRQLMVAPAKDQASSKVDLEFDFGTSMGTQGAQVSKFSFTTNPYCQVVLVTGEPFSPTSTPEDNFGAPGFGTYCHQVAQTDQQVIMKKCGKQGLKPPQGTLGRSGVDKGHIVAKSLGGSNDDPVSCN